MSEDLEVLTVEQISKQFKAHPNTIRSYIKKGKLKGTRFGQGYRVLKSSVMEVFGVTSANGGL